MSGKVVRLVLEYPWERSEGVRASTLRLVAIGLADSADQNGNEARPGVRALARRTGLHSETVGKALQALVALELVHLTVPTDGRHPARYSLNLAALSCPQVRGNPRTSDAESRALARGSEPVASARHRAAQDVLTSIRPRDDSTLPTEAGRAFVAEARAALHHPPPSEPALKGNDLTRQRGKRRFVRYQGADPPAIVAPTATGKQQAV